MKPQDVQTHFRSQAGDYPELMRRIIPAYEAQQQFMLSLLPADWNRPLHVLDLGCGPGEMASLILSRYPSAQLALLDLTDEMIECCQVRFGNDPRVTYRRGDFRVDSIGSGYDLIIASLSLHHAPVSERALLASRLFESLTPRGQIVTAEVVVDRSTEVRAHQYELWRRFMQSNGEDGVRWYEKHVAKDHPVEIDEWIGMLQQAGFQQAGCYWRRLNFAVFAACRASVDRSGGD